ncbi:hypothetical protein PUNSTDRAFT_55063 [Punctularia strigosozonata HHB-11173 SS5]|uniref:DUF6534 domain-containing protein n=1 Tax=Punctularia strigosozonata (strain HHB-11173) TaxID=741275 RepID=R7S5E3_PUNST|nr:uncharacterized protein PUNSTDRAFT_55063 [Punctularia strigosozonata HHB-11173 SS5]EIN05147.1 hypothetical protein PUNSTDRAFT_55063 [Punctularia strigosozonata HHB-11173 SS5]
MAVAVTMDNTFGATFIGLVASAILFGISNLQLYYYYNRYENDSRSLKAAVAFVWILDALILGFNCHAVYYYLVSNWGDPVALDNFIWSMKVQNFLTDIMLPTVQTLYAIRIYRLSGGRKFIPGIVGVAVVAAWGVALAAGVQVAKIKTFSGVHDARWALYASFSTATAIDILLSTCMCYYLQMGKSMFKPTNSMLNMLIFWVLSTGLLTSACSLAIVLIYAIMPNNLIYLGLDFLITKLYMNSFLAMLNARKSIRKRAENSSRGVTSSSGGVHIDSRSRGPISITVTQDKYRDVDVIPLHGRGHSHSTTDPSPIEADDKVMPRFKVPGAAHFRADV